MTTELKTRLIPFRVSESDYARLLDAAGDMTLSAYVRAILLEKEIKKVRVNRKPLKDQQQLSQALSLMMQSRMSPNINQIAKAVNCGMIIMPEEAITMLGGAKQDLSDIRTLLLEALGKKV